MNPFNSDLKRYLADAIRHYGQYIQIEREKLAIPSWMRWKTVSDKEYLVQGDPGGKNQKSLGRRNAETEAIYNHYLTQRGKVKESSDAILTRLRERAPLLRALGINKVPSTFARIIRLYDVNDVLENYLWVGGTHAIYAYEIYAGFLLDSSLGATEDLDLVWPEKQEIVAVQPPANLLGTLKAVDSTFTVNEENQFQARNSKGMVVDFITSIQGQNERLSERLKPIGIIGQDWLMLAPPISVVAVDDDGLPVRLVVPDPRLFALHKLWVANRPDRSQLKVEKDQLQGEAVLALVHKALPHLKLDKSFANLLPQELYDIWLTYCQGKLDTSDTELNM